MKPQYEQQLELTEAEAQKMLDEHFGSDPVYQWALNAIEYQIKEIANRTGAKVHMGREQACMILYALIEGGYLQKAIQQTKERDIAREDTNIRNIFSDLSRVKVS